MKGTNVELLAWHYGGEHEVPDGILDLLRPNDARIAALEEELATMRKETEDFAGYRLAKKYQQERARLRAALGNDLSGRSFVDMLLAAADDFNALGGGPLEDCLRERAAAVAQALAGGEAE